MPRLRTIAIVAVMAVVVTDVTWDDTSLRIAIGWPGTKADRPGHVPVERRPGAVCAAATDLQY